VCAGARLKPGSADSSVDTASVTARGWVRDSVPVRDWVSVRDWVLVRDSVSASEWEWARDLAQVPVPAMAPARKPSPPRSH